MIDIAAYLSPGRVLPALRARDRAACLDEMAAVLAATPEVADAEALRRALHAREAVMSTGIGLGIAVPHAKIASVHDFVLVLGRSRAGIEFQALDGKPVHLVVLIAGPENRQSRYLQILASVTLRLKREETRAALLAAEDGDAMLRALAGAGPG